MKVGLYFGSFNPIHVGHLIIANHIQQFSNLEQVWFVVSPHSPFKDKKTLANNYDRLHWVNLAISDYEHLKASNIEFDLPKPSYTIDTLTVLKEKHPNYEFSLIMGMDNLTHLKKWKNYELILKHYSIFVYPRIGSHLNDDWKNHHKITVINAPIIGISSTLIRASIKEGKNVKPLLSKAVWEELRSSNTFK